MAPGRSLPKKRNPIFEVDRTPDHLDLIQRRRLGQTTLLAKPGQVGTSNATKPENLGSFEYAHLKVPLPDNLKGSEIFNTSHPEAYFLMRRSNDGFVSATGMFKATFPWAKAEEERVEREYIKALSTTAPDEVAGNVWITEAAAVDLAKEYEIVPWIVALLDPTIIQADEKKAISPPPKYKFTANEKTFLPPPTSTPGRGRGRPRASSPTKKDKATSPRKRVTKAAKEANAATARQASETLQAALDAASVAGSESAEPPSVNGEVPPPVERKSGKKHSKEDDKVAVQVKSEVENNGDVETTHTTVSVKMPPGSPEMPLPESTEEVVSKAKRMVEEARKLEGRKSRSSSKRKAEVLGEGDDAQADEIEVQPAKKTKLMEQEVRKQKVRNRALIGVAASLAIGALIPYVLGG